MQIGDPKKLLRNSINVIEHDKEFQSWHDVTVDNAFDE